MTVQNTTTPSTCNHLFQKSSTSKSNSQKYERLKIIAERRRAINSLLKDIKNKLKCLDSDVNFLARKLFDKDLEDLTIANFSIEKTSDNSYILTPEDNLTPAVHVCVEGSKATFIKKPCIGSEMVKVTVEPGRQVVEDGLFRQFREKSLLVSGTKKYFYKKNNESKNFL